MHELTIAQAVVDQATDVLKREGGRVVKRISITIGVLSGVDAHALREAFPIACEGSAAHHCALDIEVEEAVVYCHDCRKEVPVTPPFMVCGNCAGSHVDIKKGRDMILRQIEIGE